MALRARSRSLSLSLSGRNLLFVYWDQGKYPLPWSLSLCCPVSQDQAKSMGSSFFCHHNGKPQMIICFSETYEVLGLIKFRSSNFLMIIKRYLKDKCLCCIYSYSLENICEHTVYMCIFIFGCQNKDKISYQFSKARQKNLSVWKK